MKLFLNLIFSNFLIFNIFKDKDFIKTLFNIVFNYLEKNTTHLNINFVEIIFVKFHLFDTLMYSETKMRPVLQFNLIS